MAECKVWQQEDAPASPQDEHMSSPRNNRDSTSPGISEYDSNTERSTSRKRTNTTSSGNGERRTANKICRVCGDKAFSYNFNVITCESCKAFFRRNANKEKDIRCPFSNKCEINVVSRRFCQRCRLNKCFDVGMKKEWIMSDEARLEKRQRVEENRERRMQDSMGKNDPTEGISLRSRMKSESIVDDSNQTVRDYVMKTEALRQKSSSESLSTAAPPVNTATFPTMSNYTTMEPISTTASYLDNASSNAIMPLLDMDLDVSNGPLFSGPFDTPMSHPNSELDLMSGLLPPGTASGLLPSAPLDPSVITHAQLAAAHEQVQAAINHQQQQIVAAVAQQVAAQIVSPSVPMVAPPTAQQIMVAAPQTMPSLAQSLPALSTSMLAPSIGSTVAPAAPIIHQLAPAPLGTEMVTIPKEMLLSLIENKRPQANCACTCRCGRYPANANIVDEVTKDLLAAGASSNANATSAAFDVTSKDEAKLETTEDFQMNGLIPAPNLESHSSAITPWVTAEVTIDAPPIPDIGATNSYPSMEGIFTSNLPIMDAPQVQPVVTISRPTTGLDKTDKDQLVDIEAAFKRRPEPRPFESRLRPSKPPSRDIAVVEQIARVALALPIFRSVPRRDQISLLKARCTDFHLLRVAYEYDPKRSNSENCLFGLGVQEECASLLNSLCIEVRSSSSAITLLAIICLLGFDKVGAKDAVRSADEQTRLMLKRLLFTILNEDSNKCECEFHVMMSLISRIREKSNRLPQIGRDARMVERSLAQSWRM